MYSGFGLVVVADHCLAARSRLRGCMRQSYTTFTLGVPVDTGMGLGLAVGMAPVGDSDLTGVTLLLEMPDGNTGVDVLLFQQSDLP
jgi:hypothetical protein